ncbi:MAG: DUF2948 family protein [Tagaea sp.]
MSAAQGLKLKATDAEDFRIIAACLQDALIPVGDMKFETGVKEFVLVANRFRWENCDETWEAEPTPAPAEPPPDPALMPCNSYERVNCGIHFHGVDAVRRKGLDQRDRGRVLELLTIEAHPGAVVMVFAGEAALRLEGPHISCVMQDIGEPWPTQWRPRHPAA